MSIDWSPATHAPPTYDATDETRVIGVATEAYLNALARGLRLAPQETRAIVAEVRGNLDDLAAHLRAAGSADEDAAREAVRRYGDAGRLARSIHRARRGVPWPLRALAAPLALGALGGAWFGADALATAIVSVSRHTDSLVVDYGLMRRLARAVFRDPIPAANVLGALVMLAPGAIVLLVAALALWLAGAALMRRISMRVRGMVIILAALVAAAAGGSAVLAQPTTDAMRIVTTGRDPMILALDTRAGHAFVITMGDGGTPGTVSMLNAASGTVQRTTPIGYFPGGMVVDEGRARAFIITSAVAGRPSKPSVSMLDTRSGRVQGRTPLGGSPSFVGIDRSTARVFVGMPYRVMRGRIQVLEETTGRLVQTVTLSFNPRAMAVDARRERAFIIGSDPMYRGRLAMLDTRDGRVLRTALVGGYASSALAVDARRDHVFAATVAGSAKACATPRGVCHTPGTVLMLDARDGRTLHATPVGDNPSTILVDKQTGRVFVVNSGTNGDDIGTVSVLDATTGRLVRSTTIGYLPEGAAIDERRGRVYVANSHSGTVSVLDAATGQLLRTMRVIVGPGAIVVDGRTGRIFVSSADMSDGGSGIDRPVGRGIVDQIGFISRSIAFEARELRKGRTGTVSTFDASTAP